jgi:hypothetical protein
LREILRVQKLGKNHGETIDIRTVLREQTAKSSPSPRQTG